MISPEILRRFALFAGVDPADLKEIAMLGDEISFSEGQWVFHEKEDADALYLVQSGTIDLKINLDEAGKRQADLSTPTTGDVLGWSALVEPYIYTLSAVATSAVTLVKLDAEGLRRLMSEDAELGYLIMGRLAKALGERLTSLRIQFVSLIPG
jgi:CRP-like cAMP-binding protein